MTNPRVDTHAVSTLTQPNIQSANPKARLSCPYILIDTWLIYVSHIETIQDNGASREITMDSGAQIVTTVPLSAIKSMVENALILEQNKPT